MKKFTLIISALFFGTMVSAQSFTEGTGQVYGQISLPINASGYTILPLTISYDHCVKEIEWYGFPGYIGVGGAVNYGSRNITAYDGTKGFKDTTFTAGVSCSYHYFVRSIPQLDLRVGFMLCYRRESCNCPGIDYLSNSGFTPDAFLSAAYFFKDNLGGVVQIGGLETLKLGVVLKL